jgi:hypothetical protein
MHTAVYSETCKDEDPWDSYIVYKEGDIILN